MRFSARIAARLSTAALLASLMFTSSCDQRADTARSVISAFQGSCGTTGRWSQAALSHSQAMISVMEELKATDPCKPFVSTLSTIQGLSSQINQLVQNQAYSDFRLAEEKLQELTLALQGAQAGSPLATALSASVIQTQVELAERRAARTVDDAVTERDRYISSTQQLATLMQSILKNANSGLASCLQQSPAASMELAVNLMAIGGSFVSPIVGAGAQVIGQLINTTVEYVRNAAPAAAIHELYSAQMPVALSCGLEAMSELYCNANDAFALLNVQAMNYPSPGSQPLPLWEGMDLLNRRLPILNRWLQGVKNGVLPTDPIEANRQNAIWRKLHKLDDYYRVVYAVFREGERIYNAASGSQRMDILINVLSDAAYTLAPGRQGDSPDNPFRDKSTDAIDYACWLVWGPATADCKKTSPQHPFGYDDVREYAKEVLFVQTPNADFGLLDRNWRDLFDVVDKLVTLQFSQTITADPQSLLAQARQGVSPRETPREVLNQIIVFLRHMQLQDDGANPQLPGLIKDTIQMIESVAKILDDTSCTDEQGNPIDCEIKRLKQISEIFEKFELRRSLQFFVDRISNFVEWDLQYKINHGMIPQDIQEILISAGMDIRERMAAAGVLNDLTPLVQDLNKARTIVQGNLSVFRKFFAESMGKSVEALQKAAIEAGEPAEGANRPNGQTLAQLCTLILATGQEWPDQVSWKTCSKAVLSSIYPDPRGQLTIRLDKLKAELEGKPLDVRMCAFHRFLRAGKLAEILREPLPMPSPSPVPTPRPAFQAHEDFDFWNPRSIYDYVVGRLAG